ncbi:MAG: NAD(P)H-binding protein [Alphaproteobacteria bacterium]|nr:NAD(P)H-binding protein [Alphaproteobacteria bacterium]MCB9792390.1 NAD(P)H-binding protein [Alphaproteobacteria bacterium]
MPSAPLRRVLLAGATGLVGRELLRFLAAREELERLYVLLRRPVPDIAALDKVEVLQRADFLAPLELPELDAAFISLGTTRAAAGSLEKQILVDRDMIIAVAREARAAGAKRLGVVSTLGADPRSSAGYTRMKGEMEAGVLALGAEQTVLAQPSALGGDREALGQPRRLGEAVALRLMRPLRGLTPAAWRLIEPEDVAAGLIEAVASGAPGARRLSNAEMLGAGRR